MWSNRKWMFLGMMLMGISTTSLFAQEDEIGLEEEPVPTEVPTEVKPGVTTTGTSETLIGNTTPKSEIQVLPWSPVSIEEAEPIAYDFVREADVFWSKILWRVIDCREKLNRPFVAPKMPLITVLMDAAEAGTVTLYDGLDDEFTTPLDDIKSVPALSSSTDSTWVWDPETETETLMVITNDFNPETVNKFRIKEVWFFNENTSTMEVRILGIAPIMEKYGEFGDYQGDVPLFWAFFPDLRETMVRTTAYNPLPNGVQLTFDHIFSLRLFSSYVVKEDNVDDLRIQDYTEGLNALYESERIKEELFNFEHDLWDY
jgi:gliding motility associated protien GldN